MVADVVSCDIALHIGEIILGRSSSNGMACRHYTGDDCTVRAY